MELEATREEASDAAHRETQEIETQETVTQEAENQETGPREAIARSGDLGEALLEALRGAAQAQQLDIINQHFGFREVQSDQDIHGDALYYVHTKQTSILACTPSADQMKDSVELISLVDNRPINPFSRTAFLRLGTKRKMVLLTLRENRDTEQQEREKQETGAEQLDVSTSRETEATDEVDQEQGVSTQRSVDETDESGEEPEQNILDLGAFSQLLTSAQRSGLVPEADQIGYVRDREFRMGKYDLAFQTVDAMFSRFMASAGQRTQSLAREDAEIASGRIKISPKDLLAKRARERSQTQEIERAKRRFQVVLEGLRALMNAGS